jgi:hypothetical protein
MNTSDSSYSLKITKSDKISESEANRLINSVIPEVPCRRSTFHSKFLTLKEKLKLFSFTRKTQIDSLLKKCKSKTFKTIREALKRCLLLKFDRLPQSFITNIKIEFNKKYLDLTILEIYQEFGIFTSINDFVERGLVRENKLGLLKEFLNLTLREVFVAYNSSKQYAKDLFNIREKEGEKFGILYKFISKIFVDYYKYSKGNKQRKIERRIRFLKVINQNESNENLKIFKVIKNLS